MDTGKRKVHRRTAEHKKSQLQDFVAGAAVLVVDVIIKQWSIGDVVEEELWRIEDVVDFEYFKGGC